MGSTTSSSVRLIHPHLACFFLLLQALEFLVELEACGIDKIGYAFNPAALLLHPLNQLHCACSLLLVQALEFLVELEACGIDKTGYAFMTGGRMIGRSAGSAFDQPPPDMAELEAAFVKVGR